MADRLGTPEVRDRARAAWARHLGRALDEPEMASLGADSLPEAFHAVAAAGPARPALDIDGVALTHGELDDRAGRLAARLRGRGVAAGDTVLLAAPSSLEMVVAYLGTLRAGATVLLANPTLTAPELGVLVADSGAVVALAAGPAHDRLSVPDGPAAALGSVVDLATLREETAELRALAPLPAAPPPAGAPALLAYTSGTTGRPKAVPLTHANLLSSIRSVLLAWRWTAQDVLVHALPLYHQHGLGGVHATLLAGSRAVLRSRFDPEDLLAVAGQEGATVLFAVPAMYERLVGVEGERAAALRRLRLLVSGSAPLSVALARRVSELAGQVPLERYGTTESGLDVSNPYDGPRRAGTVGLPLPGVELALADPDGAPVAPGQDGEVHLRGPQVFAGYRGDGGEGAWRDGGWFDTGDLGRIDPDDGYLTITGRTKELIITGGMNVYPREVELVLEKAPGVARAAVVGVPSARWGEEVVAAVVGAAGAEGDEVALLAFARERLAAYKCPKRIVAVDELPLNPMGKVVRADVARLVGG